MLTTHGVMILLCLVAGGSRGGLVAAEGPPKKIDWYHLFHSNPSGFESRVLRSLDGALDRLHAGFDRGFRWPWQQNGRDRELQETTTGPGGWRRNGDALRLLLQVWRHRDDPIFLPGASEALAELAQDERAVDELEAYVPQLAYMILGLPADSLLSSVLERFALRLCESNAHWALQLSWAVYGLLEDHRPEAAGGGNAEAYSRAARLLQLIEQSVVYGAKMVNRDSLRVSALTHNIQLWRKALLSKVHDSLQQKQKEDEEALGGGDGKGAAATSAATSLLPASLADAIDASAQLETGVGPVVSPPAMESYLQKRSLRDVWGCWRCCGESWSRRWFVLRGSVLFYYRSRSDTRPRGAMPMGQCRIELRPSPQGDYIKLSTRFSHRSIRIRADRHAAGEGPQLTHTWLRALRTAAGLTPISETLANGAAAAAAAAAAAPALASAGASAAVADASTTSSSEPTATTASTEPTAASSRHVLPPVDILDEANTAMDSAALTMSQRCAWLYLRAQRDFVRALAMVSEALYTPGSTGKAGVRPLPSEASERLQALLEELRPPPLAYVPLCRSSGRLSPVCRVLPDEGSVFLTRARASALVCLEVSSDEHGRKLSQLFEAVRSRGKLASELSDIVEGASSDTLALRHIRHRSPWSTSSSSGDGSSSRPASGLSSSEGGSGSGVLELGKADGGGGGGSSSRSSLSLEEIARSPATVPNPNALTYYTENRLSSQGALPLTGSRASAYASRASKAATHSAAAAARSRGAAGVAQEGSVVKESGMEMLDRIFGPSWAAKTHRVRSTSPYGRQPGWSLLALITKANDDVRQEVFVMQCLSFFASVFPPPLQLRPYQILATGPSSGLIEMVTDTLSLDRLKRKSGSASLRQHFEAAYGGSESASFASAQRNFACSLAAYSVASYVLGIKDRHNGEAHAPLQSRARLPCPCPDCHCLPAVMSP